MKPSSEYWNIVGTCPTKTSHGSKWIAKLQVLLDAATNPTPCHVYWESINWVQELQQQHSLWDYPAAACGSPSTHFYPKWWDSRINGPTWHSGVLQCTQLPVNMSLFYQLLHRESPLQIPPQQPSQPPLCLGCQAPTLENWLILSPEWNHRSAITKQSIIAGKKGRKN